MSVIQHLPATGLFRIGCAGWSLRASHINLFGEGENHLARYATRFNAVEINSSFYRPHQSRTYERWADSVPAGFRFSVKMPKAITHKARLIGVDELVAQFAREIVGLGDKLGGVLVQLPPSCVFDVTVATKFFSILCASVNAPVACEPRHASWFMPESDALWEGAGITRVLADPPRVTSSQDHPEGASSWQYWRWHGAPRVYYSPYSEIDLQILGAKLCSTVRGGKVAWCIFDNTALGHATTDAMRLIEICHDLVLPGTAKSEISKNGS